MIQPTVAYMVTRGVYDDYIVCAVFTECRGAQEFADHYNLFELPASKDDQARVEEINLYGAGWRRPPAAGEAITDEPPQDAISASPDLIVQSQGGQ